MKKTLLALTSLIFLISGCSFFGGDTGRVMVTGDPALKDTCDSIAPAISQESAKLDDSSLTGTYCEVLEKYVSVYNYALTLNAEEKECPAYTALATKFAAVPIFTKFMPANPTSAEIGNSLFIKALAQHIADTDWETYISDSNNYTCPNGLFCGLDPDSHQAMTQKMDRIINAHALGLGIRDGMFDRAFRCNEDIVTRETAANVFAYSLSIFLVNAGTPNFQSIKTHQCEVKHLFNAIKTTVLSYSVYDFSASAYAPSIPMLNYFTYPNLDCLQQQTAESLMHIN